MAQQNRKPYLHIDLESVPADKAIRLIQSWLGRIKSGILNIAGSRESKSPGIDKKAYAVQVKALARYSSKYSSARIKSLKIIDFSTFPVIASFSTMGGSRVVLE
jgi:hypothetical protein